jgi:CO/xanthine dehydrogenase Mo-binding subunit
VNSANEDLTAASPKHEAHITLRTGATRDGKLVAHEARVVYNRGAYTGPNPSGNGMLGGASRAGNFYTIPNLRIDGLSVYTNRVPCGYMRAPGQPQVVFAIESHLNLLAKELAIDPVELRMRNLPTTLPTGAEDRAGEVFAAAAEAFGWSDTIHAPRVRGPHLRVGYGMAACDRHQGAGDASSDLTLNPDGTITARTALPDNGTGGLTIVAQVVAESFGVPIDRVRVVRSDTDEFAIDVEAGGSKTTNSAGTAALAAAEQIQTQLAPLAARALGVAETTWVSAQPGGREATPGGWRSPDGKFISLDDLATELVQAGDPAAHAQVTLRAPRTPDPGYCVQMAEVEVDTETGKVRLVRLVTAQQAGTIINALGHQGQIEGGVVQGIGFALTEELVVEEGRVTTGNFGDYKLPSTMEVPPLTTVNVRSPGLGPFESKSIGEIPTIPTAGAIASAVADAIGAPIMQLPITAERVLAALEGVS